MFRVVRLTPRRLAGLLLGLALLASPLVAFAGAASSRHEARISARLTTSIFTSPQARSVKLVYRFSRPSKSFSYRLTLKKGSNWRVVKRVRTIKSKGYFKGQKKTTVKKLFAGKPIRTGSYRLKLSGDKGTKWLRFQVLEVKPAPSSRLSAGSAHTCVVISSGEVKCWGANEYGQLGDGSTTRNSVVPVPVSGISNAVQVSSGDSHSCALLADGTIKCWGANYSGQLGDASTTNSSIPVRVKEISNAKQVSANGFSSCALLYNGSIRCWGYLWNKRSRDRSATKRTIPFKLNGISGAVQVSAGGCAVLSSGRVKCWGSNMVGQLGNGSDVPGSTLPVEVSKISNAVQVSAGDYHTCVLLVDGSVSCWGGVPPCVNTLSVCLDPAAATWTKTPVRIRGISKAIEVANPYDPYSTCTVSFSGAIECWGWNMSGGREYAHPAAASRVSGISSVTQVSVGFDYICALVAGGEVKCRGDDRYGQLGNGWVPERTVPVTVTGISNADEIGLGSAHSCALLSSGAINCWGGNWSGQLGNGTDESSFVPTPVSGISNAVEMSAGEGHNCARLSNGTVWCWGSNQFGAIGDGTIGTDADKAIPVAVNGISNAVQVSAGWHHTCTLLSDQTIRCWGESLGLGNGSTGDSPVPVTVSGISNAIQLATGSEAFHACALLSGGTIKCWGSNGGKLGDGSTGNHYTPVQVSGISNALQVSVGGGHTCAVLSDHTVKCWGSNWSGQLGNGEVGFDSNTSTPVEVNGITNAVQVAAGDSHTCALLTDQTIRCWGKGGNGQLGDGVIAHGSSDIDGRDVSTTPVVVADVSSATQVSAGDDHTCALLSDRSVRCWGNNYNGQLGNGEAGYSTTPVRVVGIP